MVLVGAFLVNVQPAVALDPLATAYDVGAKFQHDGLCINVPGASTGVVQAIQWGCGTETNDNFDFVPVGDSTPCYYLKPTHVSGRTMCLDVEASGTANGTRILQYPCTGYSNQRFRLQTYFSGVRIRAANGKCIGTLNDSSTWYSGVVLRDCNSWGPGSTWQVFERYCRMCAANYANSWANDFSPDFPTYVNDCANFSSQAVAQGGLVMEESWHESVNFGRSRSWTLVEENYSYFTQPGLGSVWATYPPTGSPLNRPNYTPLIWGDIVYYDWGWDPDPVDHTSILSDWTDHDRVDSHSNPRYRVWWDFRDEDANYATTRIIAVHVDDNAPLNRYYAS